MAYISAWDCQRRSLSRLPWMHSNKRSISAAIHLAERVALLLLDLREVSKICGVGQRIDVEDARLRVADQMRKQRGANEAGASGHQYQIMPHLNPESRRR